MKGSEAERARGAGEGGIGAPDGLASLDRLFVNILPRRGGAHETTKPGRVRHK